MWLSWCGVVIMWGLEGCREAGTWMWEGNGVGRQWYGMGMVQVGEGQEDMSAAS